MSCMPFCRAMCRAALTSFLLGNLAAAMLSDIHVLPLMGARMSRTIGRWPKSAASIKHVHPWWSFLCTISGGAAFRMKRQMSACPCCLLGTVIIR